LSPFTVHLKLRIFLIIYTPIQKKLKRVSIVLLSPCFFPADSCSLFYLQRMLVLRRRILCRENKKQESAGKKQGERTMDTLFSFLKILLKCG